MKKAVYYVTDKSQQRPSIYKKNIKKIFTYLAEQGGAKVYPDTYLDTTLRQSCKYQLEKLISRSGEYDQIWFYRYSHINRKTGAMVSIIEELQTDKIYSLMDGELKKMNGNEFLSEKLSVVIYHAKCSDTERRDEELQLKIFKNFINEKTKWKLKDVYTEDGAARKEGLEQAIKDGADIICVKSFNVVDSDTRNFIKILKQWNRPVFSLKEGAIRLCQVSQEN